MVSLFSDVILKRRICVFTNWEVIKTTDDGKLRYEMFVKAYNETKEHRRANQEARGYFHQISDTHMTILPSYSVYQYQS